MKKGSIVRRYIIAGVLVWVPIWVTFLILKFLIDSFDKILSLLPKAYQPDNLLGFHIPGLGLLFALVFLFVSGMLITHFLGHRIVALWEKVLDRIPLVRTIYKAVKQVVESLLSSSEDSFRNVLLIEYPRQGLWSIAFQTSSGFDGQGIANGEKLLTVFVPTTPNPTSGFLLLVPESETKKIDIGVDQALKMVISLGVVLPDKVVKQFQQGEENA